MCAWVVFFSFATSDCQIPVFYFPLTVPAVQLHIRSPISSAVLSPAYAGADGSERVLG